jgi:hypothetical protein
VQSRQIDDLRRRMLLHKLQAANEPLRKCAVGPNLLAELSHPCDPGQLQAMSHPLAQFQKLRPLGLLFSTVFSDAMCFEVDILPPQRLPDNSYMKSRMLLYPQIRTGMAQLYTLPTRVMMALTPKKSYSNSVLTSPSQPECRG